MLKFKNCALFAKSRCFSSDFHNSRPKGFRVEKSPSDFILIHAKGGTGGNGCASFLRNHRIARGPPNGGNGGNGGNILVAASQRVYSLLAVRTRIQAACGQNGRGSNENGAFGRDTIIEVPLGTCVHEIYTAQKQAKLQWLQHPSVGKNRRITGQEWDQVVSIANRLEEYGAFEPENISLDLYKPTFEPVLLCKGGQGGFGNSKFITSSNRSPHYATIGREGEFRRLVFELKTLCDFGLVGFPNSGKSSFLRAISNAKPQVGDYPFTTLKPCLGTIRIPRLCPNGDDFKFTVADIPGIIEHAHMGKGLGIAFLRHIERARALIFIIDVSEENPDYVYNQLKFELKQYNENILKKPFMVFANKCDLEGSQRNFEKLQSCVESNVQVVPISAINTDGHERSRLLMAQILLQKLE